MSTDKEDEKIVHSEPLFESKYMPKDAPGEKDDPQTTFLYWLDQALSQIRPSDLFGATSRPLINEAARSYLQSDDFPKTYAWIQSCLDVPHELNGEIRQKCDEIFSIAKKIFNDADIFKNWKADINRRKQWWRKQRLGDENSIDLKSDKWASPTDKIGNPLSSTANIYKGMDKANIKIMFEEFSDRMRVNDKIMDEDELNTHILRTMLERFGFEAREEHIRRMLQLKCFESENRYNERQDFFNLFEAQHDEAYDKLWLDDVVGRVLVCEDTAYNRDAARRLFVGHIQLLYFPGSDLQSRSTLIGVRGGERKSTFSKILAGNTNCKITDHGIEFLDPLRWYANVPIYSEYYKNPVNRYAAYNGKGVIEDAEMTGRSKTEVDHIKNDITTVVDTRRPLYRNSGKDRPRWYDVISTTNRDKYNLEAENRRDRGMEVTKIDNEEFLRLYPRIYSSIVWLVKRQKLDAIPDPKLDNEARTESRKRIFKTDLMDILECAFAFTHIPVMERETEDQKARKAMDIHITKRHVEYSEDEDDAPHNDTPEVALYREQKARLMRRWQLSYTNKADGTRVYMTHYKGLMQFAEDYKWFYHKSNIIVKNDLVLDALQKLTLGMSELRYTWIKIDHTTTMKEVMFKQTIRGHYFEVKSEDISAINSKAVEYLKANEEFIATAANDTGFFRDKM